MTTHYESMGLEGKPKFKDMLRKIKFLFSLEKGMNFDLNEFDIQDTERQGASPDYTESQLAEVLELTKEYLKTS